MKFFKKVADKVWSIRPDLFNPHREIPDSIKEGVSAVIIGVYDYADADYKEFSDSRGVETWSERFCFTRKMVKLLDGKAVEKYSKHEFGESEKVGLKYRRNMAELDRAFGARIHKPDGRVEEVDIAGSFAISEGKKGDDDKALKRIIDIPGLEPGDVLEYFTYTEAKIREFDLPALRMVISDEYPMLEYVIEGSFSPDLTVEVRSHNGAPQLEIGIDEKGKKTMGLRLSDIPMMKDTRYVNKIREVPFYDIFVLNNKSPFRFYPKYVRPGGLYQDMPVGTVFRDISLVMAASEYEKSGIPGRMKKMFNAYRKQHPEAGNEQLMDAAWTIANYANAVEKDDSASDYWLALMFCDLMRKEKIAPDAGMAIINPLTDVPTNEIANWRQPDFGALIGERLYLPTGLNSFAVSELSPLYQGQMCAAYSGDRGKLWDFQMPEVVTMPVSKSGDNKFDLAVRLSLGEDNNATAVNELTLTGAMKRISAPFNSDDEWIAVQEEYLGVEPSKRMKCKEDSDKRSKELTDYMKELYEEYYIGENPVVSDVEILQRGITPDDKTFRLSFKSELPEAYTRAGDEILVKVGEFAGNHKKIEGIERSRSANINFTCAGQENVSITLDLPEGYEVAPGAIDALSNNVQTPLGMYITGGKMSPDGKSLNIVVRSRINRSLVAPSAWQHVLSLTDAQSQFSDAIVVLRKKQ